MTSSNERRITELTTVVTELLSRQHVPIAQQSNSQHLILPDDRAVNSTANIVQPQLSTNPTPDLQFKEIQKLLEKISERLDKVEAALDTREKQSAEK